jgi:hypothetical protein
VRVRILLVSNRLWLVAKPDDTSRTPNSTTAEHRCIKTPTTPNEFMRMNDPLSQYLTGWQSR